MQYLTEYISSSYTTLMLLAGLMVILLANRRTKIEGTQYVWAIMGIVFAITVFEYLEIWCDTYRKPLWILYIKAAATYSLYPLMMILELFLIARVKHKILIMIPYFLELPFLIADLFGANFVYGYNEDHSFDSGDLHFLPALVLCFYIVLLLVYSIELMGRKQYSKAAIAAFVSASAIVTTLFEYEDIVTGRTAEIAALEILIYYFYLAAIQHTRVQAALHKREIELEKSRVASMINQIKPHFINNSMNAIRELCYIDPEKAADTIGHFSNYLQFNIEAIDREVPIPFYKEIELVKEYISLEYADSNKKFRVEYDLNYTGFLLPALTVQPLVENAIKHGIDRYSDKSVVKISSYEGENDAYIRVVDNGSYEGEGEGELAKKRSIGLKNVSERVRLMCGGEVAIEHSDGGTTAKIRIPKHFRRVENAHDNG